MAFPSIATSATFGPTVAATSHAVTMPSGVASGDLLVMLVTADGGPTLSATGWTVLFQEPIVADTCGVLYRIADGTEGSTQNLDCSVSEAVSVITLRIIDWHGTTPPEVGTRGTGNSTAPNAPSLSPSWGAEDTLWLAVAHWQNAANVSAYPSSYTSGTFVSGTGATDGSVAYASRQLNASSEDPGAFTISTSRAWECETIAIRPAAGSAALGMAMIAQQHMMLGGGAL